jgi:serine protease Do
METQMKKPKILYSLLLIVVLSQVAQGDIVTLLSGSQLHGEVIKRTDNTLWIDIGPKIIQISMADIDKVAMKEEKGNTRLIDDSSLFRIAEGLPELSPHVQAKRVGASVIKVSTPGGLGSGVLLNGDGYAITNAHVVQGETHLRATVWIPQPDGTLMRTTIEDVELIAINNHLDLALLLLKHPDNSPFEFSVLEKAENIEVGETVFAIGNPLGLERSMSQGVISTKQRSFDGLTYIQTDAAINPGNSGGPLFNTRGEVVGITNMGITSAESLNFAIPTRYVKDFIRNREAFAYDEKNPNAGHLYHTPPQRPENGIAKQLKDSNSDSQ